MNFAIKNALVASNICYTCHAFQRFDAKQTALWIQNRFYACQLRVFFQHSYIDFELTWVFKKSLWWYTVNSSLEISSNHILYKFDFVINQRVKTSSCWLFDLRPGRFGLFLRTIISIPIQFDFIFMNKKYSKPNERMSAHVFQLLSYLY